MRLDTKYALIGVAAVVASVAYLGFAIQHNQKAHAQGATTILSPAASNVVVGTTAVTLAAANPSRKAITICNSASATNNVLIAPAPLTPTQPPSATSLGIGLPANTTTSCFTSASAATVAGQQWNGIATAASTNVLVLEWF